MKPGGAVESGLVRLLVVGLLGAAGMVQSEIYRWQDADGSWHFGDRPPATAKARVVRPKVNAVAPSAELRSAAQGLKAEAGRSHPKIRRPRVVMYSASWCGVCKRARSYFRSHHIPFKEYDVETTAKGRRDYKRLKGKGVPLILVGGRRMTGFSPGRFEQLYAGVRN